MFKKFFPFLFCGKFVAEGFDSLVKGEINFVTIFIFNVLGGPKLAGG